MPKQINPSKILVINKAKEPLQKKDDILLRYLKGQSFIREIDQDLGDYCYMESPSSNDSVCCAPYDFIEFSNESISENDVKRFSAMPLHIIIVLPYDILISGHRGSYNEFCNLFEEISFLINKFQTISCIIACQDPPVSDEQLKNSINTAFNAINKRIIFNKFRSHILSIHPGDKGESRMRIIDAITPQADFAISNKIAVQSSKLANYKEEEANIKPLLKSQFHEAQGLSKDGYEIFTNKNNIAEEGVSTLSEYRIGSNHDESKDGQVTKNNFFKNTFFTTFTTKNLSKIGNNIVKNREYFIYCNIGGAIFAAFAGLDYSDSGSWLRLCLCIISLAIIYEMYSCIRSTKRSISNNVNEFRVNASRFLNEQEPHFRNILKEIEDNLIAVSDIEKNAGEALRSLTDLLQGSAEIQRRVARISGQEIQRLGGNHTALIKTLEFSVLGTSLKLESLLDAVKNEVRTSGRLSEEMCINVNRELSFFNKSCRGFLDTATAQTKMVSSDAIGILDNLSNGLVEAAQHDHFRPTVNAKAKADIKVCAIM